MTVMIPIFRVPKIIEFFSGCFLTKTGGINNFWQMTVKKCTHSREYVFPAGCKNQPTGYGKLFYLLSVKPPNPATTDIPEKMAHPLH